MKVDKQVKTKQNVYPPKIDWLSGEQLKRLINELNSIVDQYVDNLKLIEKNKK